MQYGIIIIIITRTFVVRYLYRAVLVPCMAAAGAQRVFLLPPAFPSPSPRLTLLCYYIILHTHMRANHVLSTPQVQGPVL
jgi:hypothetical protein